MSDAMRVSTARARETLRGWISLGLLLLPTALSCRRADNREQVSDFAIAETQRALAAMSQRQLARASATAAPQNAAAPHVGVSGSDAPRSQSPLRILTLNLALSPSVPFLTQRRAAMPELIERLVRSTSPDVVMFQELAEESPARAIEQRLRTAGYEFATEAWGGPARKSGLQMAYRRARLEPLAPAQFVNLEKLGATGARAKMHAVWDKLRATLWPAGELSGALLATFRLDQRVTLRLGTAHFISGVRNAELREQQAAALARLLNPALTREAQARAMARAMARAKGKTKAVANDPWILAGDLNASPAFANAPSNEAPAWRQSALAVARFIDDANAVDLFGLLHPLENGWTQDRQRNALARTGRGTAHEPDQRLDYIFFGDSSAAPITPRSVRILREELLITPQLPLTDHWGLLGELQL